MMLTVEEVIITVIINGRLEIELVRDFFFQRDIMVISLSFE